MPRALGSKLLPLVFVLAVVAAACAEPPSPNVDIGSGVRFLPEVADPLNDAGRFSSVVTNGDGLPVVAYFAFEEELEEGEVPITRPVGLPSIPGVMLATVSDEGFWTRGAIAIADEIPNVPVAFDPAFEPSVADLTPGNVTGLQIIADGDSYHAVWGSDDGLFYATGSLDPATTTQAQVSRVTSTAGLGPSIGLVAGEPWIAFQTSTSGSGTVQLATPNGETWAVDAIADAAGCETCRTAVVAFEGSAAVAYSNGGNGVSVATNDGENAWTSAEIAPDGGQGLSGIALDGDLALSFYEPGQVTLATGAPGSFTAEAAGEVSDGSATAEGAATALAAGPDGSMAVAWHDEQEGVPIVVGEPGALEPVDTGTATVDGAFPSLAAAEDGSVTYLSWYAREEQDLLVGGYGEFAEVPIAEPSPTPPGPVATATAPTEECTPVQNGTVTVVAEGIAFTDGRCIEAPAGDPFTIAFDNRDPDTQHNVEIFAGEEPSDETLFEGDLVTGPDQAEYDVPALDQGTYAFNCVVHPAMVGEVRADGGGEGGAGQTGSAGGAGGGAGGGGAAGGGGGETSTVTAQGIQFDTSTIDLPADQESTITFVNEDPGTQHNIAIYPAADDLANALFRGDLVTGPDETDYVIDPLEAGEYYFQCDVHPDMNGTVVVS